MHSHYMNEAYEHHIADFHAHTMQRVEDMKK
jgi:hypothetical protein